MRKCRRMSRSRLANQKKRLERMPEGAGERSMIRTYLDWLVELPWAADAVDPVDIAQGGRILDDDHYGLDKIKKRILEYLAVRKLNPSEKSPILCFAGPPGVGKTSLLGKASPEPRAASSCGSAWAACTTRPRSWSPPHQRGSLAGHHHPEPAQGEHAQLRDDAGRGRQARRRPGFTVTRPRRCLRCSTRSRIRPSGTTTWPCRSTCRA